MREDSKQDFRDKILVCIDCGKEFTFTSGEAKFFWSKGLTPTKRCPNCREVRKRTLNPDREVLNGRR